MASTTSTVPAERPEWPRHCAGPSEILEWLNKLKATDGLTTRALLGMRWLVMAELDRTAPEPAEKSSAGFTHAEPNLFSQSS